MDPEMDLTHDVSKVCLKSYLSLHKNSTVKWTTILELYISDIVS